MAHAITVILFGIALGVVDSYNNLGEVVFSNVLFRHGSRMPLDFYPNDPNKDPSKWPFKVAQLTDIGKKQEYELGQWLRRRYDSLLSDHYDPDEIFIQSTDVDRTLMSAECAMGGLYHSQHNSGVTWEPVPIHTHPGLTDHILAATSVCPCPAYDAEMKRVYGLPEIQALEKKFEPTYHYVTNHSGYKVEDLWSAMKFYDTLSIEEEYNMSIPEWTRAVYPEPIKEAGLYSFVLPTWTTLMQRLKTGPLLKEMVEHFQAKRSGSLNPDRKIWFYSAHDATIAALLNALKVFDLHFPPYSACILLELRKINEGYFVTLFYRNSSVSEPQLLPIKTCSAVCPLDQFLTLVHPLLPDDWVQECQLPKSIISYQNIWSAAITASVVLLLLALILLIVCLKKRKSSRIYLTMPSPYISSNGAKNISYLQQDFMYQLPQ